MSLRRTCKEVKADEPCCDNGDLGTRETEVWWVVFLGPSSPSPNVSHSQSDGHDHGAALSTHFLSGQTTRSPGLTADVHSQGTWTFVGTD